MLDPARLQMLKDLEPDESLMLNRAVASFLARSPDAFSQISQAVLTRTAPDLVQAAHKLKGSALNLGVPRVGALCAELEDIGDSANLGPAPAALAMLTTELDAALSALRTVQSATRSP